MDKDTKRILEFLEAEGMAKGGNLSHLLKEIFGDCPNNIEQINYEANRTKDFLARLEKQELITISSNPQASLGGVTESGVRWFDNLTISAHINLSGLNWLNQQRQQKFEENLRTSVIKTNRLTVTSLLITTFITAFLVAINIETNSRERRREKREIEQAQQSKQEAQSRTEWERQLQTSFHQLNQALLRLDTSEKKIKLVSVEK